MNGFKNFFGNKQEKPQTKIQEKPTYGMSKAYSYYSRLKSLFSKNKSNLTTPEQLNINWEEIVKIRQKIESSQNGEGMSLTEEERNKRQEEVAKLLAERVVLQKKKKFEELNDKYNNWTVEIEKAQKMIDDSLNGKGESMTPATRENIKQTIEKMKKERDIIKEEMTQLLSLK